MPVQGDLSWLVTRLETTKVSLRNPEQVLRQMGKYMQSVIGRNVPRDVGRVYRAIMDFEPQVRVNGSGGEVSVGNPVTLGRPEDEPPRGLIKQFLEEYRELQGHRRMQHEQQRQGRISRRTMRRSV